MTNQLNESDTASEKDRAIQAEYDWTVTPPSTAVIETVAAACDRDPLQLEPLYEVVDPDALDALIRSSGGGPVADGPTVTFEFAEKSVTVHGGGAVVVRPVGSATH